MQADEITIEAARTVLQALPGLLEKSKQLVDLMTDAEQNHGGLIGSKTLTAANQLRLELSKWK